jgi:hypothetical protein
VIGQNDNADPDPQTEDARNPDAHEETVFVADEKPQRDAGEEADECADEKRVVDFVKHG